MGCFHVVVIMNNAAMNVDIQTSLWNLGFNSFGFKPRNEFAQLYDNSIFNFQRNWHTVFHSSWALLHFNQQDTRVPKSPRPSQYLLFLFLFIYFRVATLMEVRLGKVCVKEAIKSHSFRLRSSWGSIGEGEKRQQWFVARLLWPWTSGFRRPHFIPWVLGSHESFFHKGVMVLWHQSLVPTSGGRAAMIALVTARCLWWDRATQGDLGLGMNIPDQYFETSVACLPLKRSVLQSFWGIPPRRRNSKVSTPREHNSGHMFQ